MTDPRVTGTVLRWCDQRCFGFLTIEGSDGELFVHGHALRAGDPRLNPGDRVELSLGRDRHGRPVALDVDVVERFTHAVALARGEQRYQGTVRSVLEAKQIAFIRPHDDEQATVFLLFGSIVAGPDEPRAVKVGDRVRYSLAYNERGPRAERVEIVAAEAVATVGGSRRGELGTVPRPRPAAETTTNRREQR